MKKIRIGLNKQGITLIEILIATGILSMVLLPAFLTFSSGTKNIKISESEFRAHLVTLELIEQLSSLPYRHIPVGEFSSSQIKSGKPLSILKPVPFKITVNDKMESTVKVEILKKETKEKFKKISVSTSFSLGKTSKLKRIVTLKTLVANESN